MYSVNIASGLVKEFLAGDAFVAFGEVSSASIIKDKFSGESRGFGFVEKPNKETLFATKGGCPRKGSPPFFISGGSLAEGAEAVLPGGWAASLDWGHVPNYPEFGTCPPSFDLPLPAKRPRRVWTMNNG
jgi:hypothetical protein